LPTSAGSSGSQNSQNHYQRLGAVAHPVFNYPIHLYERDIPCLCHYKNHNSLHVFMKEKFVLNMHVQPPSKPISMSTREILGVKSKIIHLFFFRFQGYVQTKQFMIKDIKLTCHNLTTQEIDKQVKIIQTMNLMKVPSNLHVVYFRFNALKIHASSNGKNLYRKLMSH
jgi:hypothetical protein